MKRVGRYIFNALAVLSLLLAILVAGAWGRSYWWMDQIAVESRDGRYLIHATLPRGELQLTINHDHTPGLGRDLNIDFRWYRSLRPEDSEKMAHSFIGFGWEQGQLTPALMIVPVVSTYTELQIPDAYLLALFAALPAFRFYRRVRRRVPVGCCKQCGYDLRASPDRCPECGTVPTEKA